MSKQKKFKYDVLIERDNVCDRQEEIDFLTKAALAKKRIILFAPRRYGKTSLVKNVVASDFRRKKKNSYLIYADFLGVNSLASISERLRYALSNAISENFNTFNLLNRLKDFFSKLKIKIEVDDSGKPSLSLDANLSDKKESIKDLLFAIKELSQKGNCFLILDEFQDISLIEEAQALFRSGLQELSSTSVFILGSKQHLLDKMFSNANAPLFQYGDEIHLKPILPKYWLPYFRERLKPSTLKIEKEALNYILEMMNDVPNAICEIGAWLVDNYSSKSIDKRTVDEALRELIEKRTSYIYRVQHYSEKERKLLFGIATTKFVLEPYSAGFLELVGLAKSSVEHLLKKMFNDGVLEYELSRGYRLSDPILAHYLKKNPI